MLLVFYVDTALALNGNVDDSSFIDVDGMNRINLFDVIDD